jgi:hypothetical protein
MQAFNKLHEWLEVAEDTLHSVKLRVIMQELAGKMLVYSEKHLKDELLGWYKCN